MVRNALMAANDPADRKKLRNEMAELREVMRQAQEKPASEKPPHY